MAPEDIAENTAPAVTEESAPSTEAQVTDDTEQSAQPETETETGTVENEPQTEGETPEVPGAEPRIPKSRFDQVVAKQRDAEREAAYWRGVAEGRNPAPTEEPIKRGPNGEELPPEPPKIEAYENYADYEKDREQWLIERAKFEYRQEDRAKAQVEAQRKAKETFDAKVAKLAATNPDIKDVLSDPTLPVSDVGAAIIRQSDVGPEIALYLNDHRDEATKIYGMHPVLAARELGRIEAKIIGTQSQQAPPTTKKISQAPEPIQPLGNRGAPSVDLDTVSMDEFVKRRNKEQYGKGR
jgi:hypothetical protein